jgi:hypothetical protein
MRTIFELLTPRILNQYFHFMYGLNALKILDIAVTSLRHVSAWEYHLEGVHTKLKNCL